MVILDVSNSAFHQVLDEVAVDLDRRLIAG